MASQEGCLLRSELERPDPYAHLVRSGSSKGNEATVASGATLPVKSSPPPMATDPVGHDTFSAVD